MNDMTTNARDAIPIGQNYLDIISHYKYAHGLVLHPQNLTFHVGYGHGDITRSAMDLPDYLD